MDKMQQAIALIKSGDKQGGQRLLAEVVTADPKNEMAWLWLTSVAPAEKRRYCLEKVLSINPNNEQARQLLERLRALESQTQAQPSVPVQPSSQVQPATAPEKSQESTPTTSVVERAPVAAAPAKPSVVQHWSVAVGKEVRIILFQGAKLISFDVMPDRVPRVLSQVNQVAMTKEWYEKNIALGFQGRTYKSAPLNRILRVHFLLNGIKIEYRDETGEDITTEIYCKEDKVSNEVMESLQERLGDKYERTSAPTNRRNVLVTSLVIFFVPACLTSFFYWGVQQPAEGVLRGRLWMVLLVRVAQFLGPNGILCIGGGLTLVALIIAVMLFIKPPMETLLTRKGLRSA